MAEDVTRIDQADHGRGSANYFGFTEIVLVTGNSPTISTEEVAASGALPLPAYSVVGRDENNELVLATPNTAAEGSPSNAIEAIGVTAYSVDDPDQPAFTNSEPGAGAAESGPVSAWRDGCFNPNALNWSQAFQDAGPDAQRLAFENGHSQVYIREPQFDEGV